MTWLSRQLRSVTERQAWWLGLIGALVVALSSHAAGATRSRGGPLHVLGLTSLTFGHMMGIMVAVMWIGVILLLISWIATGAHILRLGRPLSRFIILAWTLPFLVAGPIMSRDVYSYLMQGTLARDGINPYKHGAAANPGPLLFEVSADWRNTTTPYGPLHLWIGDLITSVTGDNVTVGVAAYKLLSLASVAVMAWAVARLASHFGFSPSVAVWLGVANPLSLIHLVGGMHNENIMMAMVLIGLLLGLTLRPIRGLLAGALLIGLATSLKATAFIALPFLVWIFVARWAGPTPARSTWFDTPRRLGTLVWSGFLALSLTVGTIAIITWVSGQTWGWVAEMTGNTKVINPLALPSFLASIGEPILSRLVSDDITFNLIVNAVRPVSSALMLVGLVAVWWFFRRDPLAAIKGASLAYLVTCIFNTVTLPWYYTAFLALFAIWARDRRGVFVTVWLLLALSMMFDGGGNNRLYNILWVVGIGAATWWLARTALGYSPARPADACDDWTLHTKTSETSGASRTDAVVISAST